MGKKITIVAGGSLSDKFLPEIKKSDFIIAADRGAYWLIKHRVKPDLSLGDFDSVNLIEFDLIKKNSLKVRKFLSVKDQTDLELAIDEAVKRKPGVIEIYGASGTRLDHTLAAIQLLEKYINKNILITIIDEHNEIILASKNLRVRKSKHKYISLLSQSEESEITLEKFKYLVNHKIFRRGESIGISNELTDSEGNVTVHRGRILVIKSRD